MSRWTETVAGMEAELEGLAHVPRGILAYLRAGWAPEYPVELARGSGGRVWDASGREHVDWVMGKGPVILGHGRAEVVEAAAARAASGGLLPGLAPEYGALAARVAGAIEVAERVAFAKNGSDAVSIAMRLARIDTGRRGVLSAGYHGWDDRVQGAPGVAPTGVSDFGYDLDALERALAAHGEAIAAVLITPEPAFLGAAHLARVAELARGAGARLIVDEVRCGMRVAIGGAHERFGVRPDLIAMSKGLANGFPLSLVAGRADVMEASARTFVFGSNYGEAVALAAGLATFEIALAEGALARLADAGERLARALAAELTRRGAAACVIGPRAMPTIVFERPADEDAFYARAAAAGVLFFQDDAQCPSAAHGEAEITDTMGRLGPALDAIEGRGEVSDDAIRRYAARRMIAPGAFDVAHTRAQVLGP